MKKSIEKLTLSKETVSVLNREEGDSVKGGWTPIAYGAIALTGAIVGGVHDYGDANSWWHCTQDTNYAGDENGQGGC